MFIKLVIAFSAPILLGACATSIEAFHNRPVVEDTLKGNGKVSVVSLSADRRTVIVVPNDVAKFCAEPPPDTAKEISTQLKADIEAKAKSEKAQVNTEGKVGIEDKLDTKIVVIGKRTEAVEAFRAGLYALCQYNANGGLDQAALKASFDNLLKTLFPNEKQTSE